MGRAAVAAQIARLEAVSRSRELDDRESWQLQKLITTERRYEYSQRRASPQPPVPSPQSPTEAEMKDTVPLNKLILSPRNVRKTNGREDIESLADSIQAKGLLQNLVVSEGTGGKGIYEVDAGGRRYHALMLLAGRKAISRNLPVPVLIVPREDATEASLAENLQKIAMNPADEAEAFVAILDREGDCGVSTAAERLANCARRFGVSVRHVEQRLRLAALAPDILAALREGRITLDAARAYAGHPDHKQQLQVFKAEENKGSWGHGAKAIKDALAGKIYPAGHKAAVYVGLDAYAAAGGRVEHDLFMSAEDREILLDPSIVDRLCAKRTEEAANELAREQGWAGGVVKPWSGPYWQDAKAPKGFRRDWHGIDKLSEDRRAEAIRAFAIADDGSTLEPLTYFFVPDVPAAAEAAAAKSEPYDYAAALRADEIEIIAARLAAPSVAGTPLEGRAFWPVDDCYLLPISRDEKDGTVVVALLVTVPAAEVEARLAEAEAEYERRLAEPAAQAAAAEPQPDRGPGDEEDERELEEAAAPAAAGAEPEPVS